VWLAGEVHLASQDQREPVVIGVLLLVLVAAAICDCLTGKIYNALTYPGIVAGLVLHGAWGGWAGLEDALLGFAMGFGPLFVAYLIGGYGGGDAKLMGAVGALGGFNLALGALMYALIVAVGMGLVVMIWRRQTLATMRRVVRMVWLALAGGKPADPTPSGGITVRFGLAICVGTCWYLLEARLGVSLLDAALGWLR